LGSSIGAVMDALVSMQVVLCRLLKYSHVMWYSSQEQ
jgi:hypothetical protein